MNWKWVVGGLLLTYGGLFLASGLFESTDCANCWQAAASLRGLVLAEEEFRQTDADKNPIRDYWRKDVAGLYTLAPPNGEPLKFIELSTAQADGRPASMVPGDRISKCAYWFQSLGFKDEKTPDPARFAFCAYPDDRVPKEWNEWTFIVDHQGVVYGKRVQPYGPPEFFPVDPSAEGWRTAERIRKIRWTERNPLWWVRFWSAL